jgi:hypothetical protein
LRQEGQLGAAWFSAFPPWLLRASRRAVDVQVQVAPGLPAFAIVFTINPG